MYRREQSSPLITLTMKTTGFYWRLFSLCFVPCVRDVLERCLSVCQSAAAAAVRVFTAAFVATEKPSSLPSRLISDTIKALRQLRVRCFSLFPFPIQDFYCQVFIYTDLINESVPSNNIPLNVNRAKFCMNVIRGFVYMRACKRKSFSTKLHYCTAWLCRDEENRSRHGCVQRLFE